MEKYKEEKSKSDRDERKQAHIDLATNAIRKDITCVTIILDEKGLQIYSNLVGAPLHSLLAMSTHTMLGSIPKEAFKATV